MIPCAGCSTWLSSASRSAGVPDVRTGTWCSASWRSCSPTVLPADPWLQNVPADGPAFTPAARIPPRTPVPRWPRDSARPLCRLIAPLLAFVEFRLQNFTPDLITRCGLRPISSRYLLENSPNRSISICASSGSVRSVWSFFRWPRRSSSPAIRLASVFPCLTPPDQVYLFLHLQFLFMRHSFAPPISDSFLFLCLLLREHIINHQVVAAYSSYTQFHGACLLHVGFFRKDTPLFCRYDKPDSAFWDFIYFTLVVAALV